jgi:hypothetical protein
MYSDNIVLLVSSIFIYTLVRLSIFLVPFVRKWVGVKSEETILKNDVSRIIESVDNLVKTLDILSKETNDKRAEIFLKLQNHDDRIEYVEKDTEKMNQKIDKFFDELSSKR